MVAADDEERMRARSQKLHLHALGVGVDRRLVLGFAEQLHENGLRNDRGAIMLPAFDPVVGPAGGVPAPFLGGFEEQDGLVLEAAERMHGGLDEQRLAAHLGFA